MANERQLSHTTGKTVYAQTVSQNGVNVGEIWNAAGLTFQTYSSASVADYDEALTEEGTASQIYLGTFNSNIIAGKYFIIYREQAGGSPAETDLVISTENVDWDGSDVITLDALTVALDTQGKADVNLEVDNALNTAIPGGPTANSINERVKAIDDKLPTGTISDFNEATDQVDLKATGLDLVIIETGITAKNCLKAMLAATAGESSGLATATATYKNPDGTKTRITASVDADGNRSSITLNFA